MTDSFLIDRVPPISLFRDMLSGAQQLRILRILGEAKMGKSRLIREYRRIVIQEWNGHCALVDHYRSKLQSYDDILHTIVQQLGSQHFPNYQAVYNELVNQAKVDIKGLAALFSTISVNTSGRNEARQWRKLTMAFLEDLQKTSSIAPIVLLFDAFEKSDEQVQSWLYEHFMTGIYQMPHVWIVVAGQQIPSPLLTWEHTCHTYLLPPVSIDDHRAYCAEIGAELSDDFIEKCHKMFQGKPGLIVEFVGTSFGRKA